LLFFFFFVSSAANRFAVTGALIVLVEGYSLRSASTGKGPAREDLSSRGAASKDSVRGEVMRLSSRPGRDRRVELGVQTDREGYRAPVV
jgi:hypothetical protein